MDRLIARARRALRAFVEDPSASDVMPALIPTVNPLESEPGSSRRQMAALRMMDDDCYGFLLITVHRESVGPLAHVELAEHLESSWLPAIIETLDRLAMEFEAIS
jgi:hypothetical protein